MGREVNYINGVPSKLSRFIREGKKLKRNFEKNFFN